MFVIFIYNPQAGKANITRKLHSIVARYRAAEITLILHHVGTKHPIDNRLKELIELTNPKHILLAGGDGTINRYINWAIPNGIETPIAIMPTGTANDLALELGYSTDLKDNLTQILAGNEKKIDVVQANDRYFVNILSCGMLTDVSQRTPTVLKNTLGKLAYYIEVLGEIPSFNKMHLTFTAEGEKPFDVDCLLFFVFNGKTAGNMLIAKNADIDDGLLEVIIAKGGNIAATIGNLIHVITKQKGKYPKDVIYLKTPSLKVEGNTDIMVDLDGEKGVSIPLEIKCLHKKLTIII